MNPSKQFDDQNCITSIMTTPISKKSFLNAMTVCVIGLLLIVIFPACEYDVLVSDQDMEPDTSTVCNPEILYFERDVLPVFRSSCGFEFCHDADDASAGVVLTDYESIMQTGQIVPFDPDGSHAYQVIVESNLSEIMPPFPRGPLSERNIETIRKWISQGALNLTCDPPDTLCITTNVRFSTVVWPIIDTYCEGCHSGSNPFGGIFLRDYNDVRIAAENGTLLGSIAHLQGFSPMPKNMSRLDQCQIDQVGAWIADGAPDN